MIDYKLKKKMAEQQVVYGIFINSGSSIACEAAGLSGFDFALIDSEHGPTDVIENRELITACEIRGTAPIVRVKNGGYDTILKMLDVGAHGVMVPQVNDPDYAKQIVNAALYSPEGNRGIATTRSSDYGFYSPMSEFYQAANERNLVIVQCENIKALPYLDEICSVQGIDVVFIGPYDLSSSMGKLGHVAPGEIREIIDRVLACCKEHGKYAGIFTKDVNEAKQYANMGFRFIIVGTDISCMANGMKNIAGALRGVILNG